MFLQVRWPTQQCQSTEGGWLVIQIALNLTRLISPCYNNTTCMHIQDNGTQRNLSTVSEPSEMKKHKVDLPRSRHWLAAHDQRLVPVLLVQVEHIQLIAAGIGQRIGPRVDATKDPHLMAIERTTVIRQRRWTSVCLQPTQAPNDTVTASKTSTVSHSTAQHSTVQYNQHCVT